MSWTWGGLLSLEQRMSTRYIERAFLYNDTLSFHLEDTRYVLEFECWQYQFVLHAGRHPMHLALDCYLLHRVSLNCTILHSCREQGEWHGCKRPMHPDTVEHEISIHLED